MDNAFYINENSVSRIHFSIYFENSAWFIADGDGEKKSTSGTWCYVEEPFAISNGFKVKIGDYSTLAFTLK